MPTFTNYCSPLPLNADFIDNFSTTGGITNITNNGTGCNGTAPNNYTYYSTMSVAQVQGLSFTVSMQCGTTFAQGFRVWIDYNNDLDFSDPGEDVFFAASGFPAVSGTVTIPMLTTPGVKRMRVMCRYATTPAVGDFCGTGFAFGECEDYNLTVIAATPCTGTPTAGSAVASVTNPCPGVNVSVGLVGSSFTGGLAYQWLQGTNCVGPWSPISGLVNPSALTPTLVVSAVGGTTLGYRCRITCTNSGLSDTSTSACVAVLPWSCTSTCFGASTAQNAGDQDIFNVSMGSLNNTTDCIAPLTGSQGAGTGTASMYADFTGTGGVPAPAIYKGLTQPFSLTIGTCGASVPSSVKMYIDFNHNTVFTDPGEEIYSNAAIASVSPSAVITGSFLVPGTASTLTGCTKMRVVMMSTWIGTVMSTGAYPYGETEDYSVNIIQPSASDPAITAINVPAGTCFSNNETVAATLCNYGSSPIDLSVNNVTVTLNVNTPTGIVPYTAVANSGVLAPYGATCVPVTFNGVDMYAGGSYSINTSLTISGLLNGNLGNDSLSAPILRSNYRPSGGAPYHLCQGSIIPFGQGLTVSGCATPVPDSVTITFTLASTTSVPCLPTTNSYLGACLMGTATMPVLPPGSTITSGILKATNLGTTNGGWAQETRLPIFKGSLPVTATNIVYPSAQGNPALTIANYTWQNLLNAATATSIYTNVGGGNPFNLGYNSTWAGNATTNGMTLNSGSPTVATLKLYYNYVPASFEWYAVPVGGSVLYQYSPFNPIGVAGSGVPNSNTPGTTPFYAACAGSSDCRIPVDLVIDPVPTVIQDTLESCEYAVGSNSAVFCLDSLNSSVSNGMFPTYQVEWFGDQALFIPIIPTCGDTTSTTFVYSKVIIPTTGCASSDSVLLKVYNTPEFVSNPLLGNACAPSSIDVASLINPFTTTVGADTLYFSDQACTIPHPNPHAIYTQDTVYMVLVTPTTPSCSDTTSAIVEIVPASNWIINQDTLGMFSYCGSVGCANLLLGDGNTETLYSPSDCRKIAKVTDLSNGIAMGATQICEDIDCSVSVLNGQPYVNRHYEITPSVNDSAYVCLYYLNQDFLDYDAAATGVFPPMDPYTNLCITQVDNGDITTPGHTAISIPNSAITSTFDPLTEVWEVCFKVDSFSFFYCATCNPFNIPLPVYMLSFTGKRTDAGSDLKWITSTEHNNSYFIVERSKDAKNYNAISSKIASKAPGGNSVSELSYDYLDAAPFNGHNYYRLQQVDIDGHTTHSKVVDVYYGDETLVTLYPNPVNTELTIAINTPKATTAYAKVMDATGRVVRVIEMNLQAGNNTTKVEMESLSDGMYMINVTNNHGLNFSQTIRKQ